MGSEERLGVKDILVIFILWFYEFISSWMVALTAFNVQVVSGDEFLRSNFYVRYTTILLFLQCILAVVVGLIVDSYDHKFAVSFVGMCLNWVLPFIGLFVLITESVVGAMVLTAWAKILFIVSPATFGVIFSQKKARRRHTREIVLTVGFFEGLSNYVMYLSIPAEVSRYSQYKLIMCWCILLAFFTCIFTSVERLRHHVNKAEPQERGFEAVARGAYKDWMAKKSNKQTMHLLIFLLLLIPSLSLTALDSVVIHLNERAADTDDTQYQHTSLRHVAALAQLMMLPSMEILLTVCPIRETLGEMLILSLAHMMNIGVLGLLVLRMSMTAKQKEQNGNVSTVSYESLVRGPRGEVFWDPAFRNVKNQTMFEIKSLVDTTLLMEEKGVESESNTYMIYPGSWVYADVVPEENQTHVELTFKEEETGKFISTLTVQIILETLYVFHLRGNTTAVELVQIFGVKIIIEEQPSIIILSDFVGTTVNGIYFPAEILLDIKSTDGEYEEYVTVPHYNRQVTIKVPVKTLEIKTIYTGVNETIKEALWGQDNITFTTSLWGFYKIEVVCYGQIQLYGARLVDENRMKQSFETKATENVTKIEPEKPDGFLLTSYTMLGASMGLASVGYIHFFWTESPVRLRCTLFALYRVSQKIVAWIAPLAIGDMIDPTEVSVLLGIQVATTLWHFLMVWVFDVKFSRS